MHKGFECLDCGEDTFEEYYMLYDFLWLKVVPENKGMLCVGCVENRLERKLVPIDFTDFPVNKNCFGDMSDRLKNRLGL